MISVQKTASLLFLGHSVDTGLARYRVCHQKVRVQLSPALSWCSTVFQSLNIYYPQNPLTFLNDPLFYHKLLFYLSLPLPSSLVSFPSSIFYPLFTFWGWVVGSFFVAQVDFRSAIQTP